MICPYCRYGADRDRTQDGILLEQMKAAHKACVGGTHCTCQHRATIR